VLLSNKLANQLKNTKEIEVEFVEPKEFVALLDIKSDTFNTAGLVVAYSKLDNSCK
jgi:hypothetical protein